MARRTRLIVAVLAAVLVTAAGCTLPTVAPNGSGDSPRSTQAPASKAAGTADWRPCPDVPQGLVGRGAQGMTYDCADVSVPQDWHNPSNGKTFSIAMIRIRSDKQTNRIGSLLLNPGGPGGSGIDTAVYLSFGAALGGLPEQITDQFDLIGFDPRGVGRSDPVKCISPQDEDENFGINPDPLTQAQFDQTAKLQQKIVTGCANKYGEELSLFSTEQAARDMDALRGAVGDDKLTYLGFSYGTLLGATYAQLFPTKIRAMVLDGAVDPKQTIVQGSESQAMGFERAFTNFSNWCKQQTAAKCPIAPDAHKAVTDALATAATKPVKYADGRSATQGWILTAVTSSLYTETGWTQLANAVAQLKGGDAKGVMDLADQYAERNPDGTYSNLFDANFAVNCADAKDTPSVDQIRQLQGQWRQKYPLFGGTLALGMLQCAYYPETRDPYPTGPATGAPPIVVVGTTGDPATPYENTAALANMLGVGHVLTWEGEGHTAYPSTPCIVNAVDDYIIDLKVPQEGLRCPPQ